MYTSDYSVTRISSLNLLAELLVENPKLKRKYC